MNGEFVCRLTRGLDGFFRSGVLVPLCCGDSKGEHLSQQAVYGDGAQIEGPAESIEIFRWIFYLRGERVRSCTSFR